MGRLILLLMVLASGVWADPIEWKVADGGNGHFYEVFDASLDWFGADTAAGSTVFMGSGGHLATVTSLAEHEFLTGTFADPASGLWLGGVQAPGSAEPGGGWGWITGEPFVFTRWNPSEPNDAAGGEERIELRSEGTFRGWNDQFSLDRNSGYIVEWDPSAPLPIPEPEPEPPEPGPTLFEETFDSPDLPATLNYVADADFAWSVNGSHQLFADRSAATRGVATAISTEGFALPASGLFYSADMGTPIGALAASYNVGLIFGDYIALFHPGLADFGGSAFRLEKIEGVIDPREPALVGNTGMGFVPVQGSLHRVQAFVMAIGGALSIDVSITGLGTDGQKHTFTHSFLDTSPGFGLGSVGVAMRGGSSPGIGDDGFFDNLTVRSTEPTPIPEPFTLALVGLGAGVVAWRKRRPGRARREEHRC